MYKIKAKRLEKGWSQEELEQKSGVSRAIISALETKQEAQTSTATLLKLSHALGCTVNEIFIA